MSREHILIYFSFLSFSNPLMAMKENPIVAEIVALNTELYMLCRQADMVKHNQHFGAFKSLEHYKQEMAKLEQHALSKIQTSCKDFPELVNAQDENNFTPAIAAAWYGMNNILEYLLLEQKVPTDTENNDGKKVIDVCSQTFREGSEDYNMRRDMHYYLQTPEGDRHTLCQKLIERVKKENKKGKNKKQDDCLLN